MNHTAPHSSIATSWHLMHMAHRRVAQQKEPDKKDQPPPQPTPEVGPRPVTPEIPTPQQPLPGGTIRA